MIAKDIMTTQVVSARPKASVREAADQMLQYRISGLPVIDDDGQLVGMLTEGDFLRRGELGTSKHRPRWLEFIVAPGRLADEYVHAYGRTVAETMSCNPISISEDLPLEEIVRIMERRHIKRLPVTKNGRVIGIVSRADLVRALTNILPEASKTRPEDSEIRRQLLEEIEKRAWCPGSLINVLVHNGVVELWGTVLAEREREALRVAAENVPGVTEVKNHVVWVEPLSGMAFGPDDDVDTTASNTAAIRK
jgi:CBS domain-containing protein